MVGVCKATQKVLCGILECLTCFERSFASHEKAEFWNYKKNNKTPIEVTLNSKIKMWFTCIVCNHEFETILTSVANGSWCPYCANRTLCEDDKCIACYNKSFASHYKAISWSDKNFVKARQVFLQSHKKYLFNCIDCKHEFSTKPSIINKGCWCRYCGNQELCKEEDCKICYKKSFANNPKAAFWSDKNALKPREIFKSSTFIGIFDCIKCNHEFSKKIAYVNDGDWCPYCSSKALCTDINCIICFDKSFASNIRKSECWYNNGNITPREVFKFSLKKFNFKCNICHHEFNQCIDNISSQNQWCPYCAHQKLCEEDSCTTCYNNSFASHFRSKYWDQNNITDQRSVFKYTRKKYMFVCEELHNFTISLANVTCSYQWCPLCKHKTEKKLYNWFKDTYTKTLKNFNVEGQTVFKWCINLETGKYLRCDFYIKLLNLIIELDGRQHYQQVSNWDSPIITQKRDRLKEKLAQENNYKLYRLLQSDVYNDLNNWEKKLKYVISQNIIYYLNKKGYSTPYEFKSYLVEKPEGYIYTNTDIKYILNSKGYNIT